jgi:hypothetical protein
MRTFFFSTEKQNCSSDCRWWICPHRYFAALRKIDSLSNIETLGEAPTCFAQLPEKAPKNGDLIILYATDLSDLDAMVQVKESFDGLKKILVIADPADGDDRKYHLLEPRYITQAGRNIAELEAVIHKMAESVH